MAKKKRAGNSKAAAAARRAKFVEAYCENGGNGREAYKAAGFPVGKPTTMDPAISKLLKRPDVAAMVEKRREESLQAAMAKTDLTADEVISSLARDIRFDPAKLFRADGTMMPVPEMDEDTRLALRSMEVEDIQIGRGEDRAVIGQTSKVKFPEKTAAREQAMKHFGLYERDNKQKPVTTVNVGVLTVKPDGMHFEKVRARALQRAP